MPIGELLGYTAGALVTISIVPQLIRVFKPKSAREISTLYPLTLTGCYPLGRLRFLFQTYTGYSMEHNLNGSGGNAAGYQIEVWKVIDFIPRARRHHPPLP